MRLEGRFPIYLIANTKAIYDVGVKRNTSFHKEKLNQNNGSHHINTNYLHYKSRYYSSHFNDQQENVHTIANMGIDKIKKKYSVLHNSLIN